MNKTLTYHPVHNSAYGSLVSLRPSQNACSYHRAKVDGIKRKYEKMHKMVRQMIMSRERMKMKLF